MSSIRSACCEYAVSFLEDADAYCYVCGEVHAHKHLDLRHLKGVLLGQVTARHNLNWDEIAKDAKKSQGMRHGIICQSLATELQALCQHGQPVHFDGQPLRLHMCFGKPADERSTDMSVAQGLDFTSDLCSKATSSRATPPADVALAAQVSAFGERFKVGDILKYNPTEVAFEHA